jgi:hypothetical protein
VHGLKFVIRHPVASALVGSLAAADVAYRLLLRQPLRKALGMIDLEADLDALEVELEEQLENFITGQ